MNNSPYIFTEAYNCGLLLRKFLDSFYQFHPSTIINVFGTENDFKGIEQKDTFNFIILDDEHIKYSYLKCFNQ